MKKATEWKKLSLAIYIEARVRLRSAGMGKGFINTWLAVVNQFSSSPRERESKPIIVNVLMTVIIELYSSKVNRILIERRRRRQSMWPHTKCESYVGAG